jgi:pyruvate/oxaloacetate carboxyltransferase
MFLLNGNRLPEGVAFTDANGNQYPANWLNLSTEEEKAAVGITWSADPVRADDRFYWDGDVNNPKDLDGLKTQFVAQIKDTAGKLLSQTDWVIIRKAERNVEVPADVATKRASIVTEANRLEVAINGASTVEALIEVLNAQNWGE